MNSFWFTTPIALFSSSDIIPDGNKSLEENFNTITRLFIFLWFILFLFEYPHHELFFILSLFIIVLLYFVIEKTLNKMIKENYDGPKKDYWGCNSKPAGYDGAYHYFPNYEPVKDTKTFATSFQEPTLALEDWQTIPKDMKLKIQTPSQYRFCNDERVAGDNSSFFSTNQALAGRPSQKTLAPVPVIPPIYAFDYWSEDFVVPTGINKETNQELFQSGYIGLSKCNQYDMDLSKAPSCYPPKKQNSFPRGEIRENFNDAVVMTQDYQQTRESAPLLHTPIQNLPLNGPMDITVLPSLDTTYANLKSCEINGCGYNTSNTSFGLPVNAPSGECQRTDALKEYNKNLYTNIIEPGQFYQQNQVLDPISTNMGITYAQQFEPLECKQTPRGKIVQVLDPATAVCDPSGMGKIQVPASDRSNIYDPRFFGYGTNYRSYIDTLTGQPRFYYDDIESVRKPNYIGRSNIDFLSWSGSNTNETDGSFTLNMSRPLAQKAFIDDSNSQREELQQRYMRKVNSTVIPQRRLAPLRRDQR